MYNECRHIMPSGRKCHSPALSGKPFCYYHIHLQGKRLPPGQHAKQLPAFHIEDARGIQMALQQVLAAVESPWVHPRSIGLALYGLQLAIQIVDRAQPPEPADTVRTLSNLEGQPLAQTDPIDDTTEVLAPAATHCEPPHDCARCRHQETCETCEESDEAPEFEEEEEDDTEDDDDSDPEGDEDDEDEDRDDEDNEVDDDSEEDDDGEEEDEDDEGNEDEEDEEEDSDEPHGSDAADDEDALVDAALRILREDTQRPKRRTSRKTSPRRQGPNPRAA